MSAKRKYPGREEAPTSTEGGRKARKGFTVGPDNLPDGTYRRKGSNPPGLPPLIELTSLKRKRLNLTSSTKPKSKNHTLS